MSRSPADNNLSFDERCQRLAAGYDRASNWLGASALCIACCLLAVPFFGIAGAVAVGVAAFVSDRMAMKIYRETKADEERLIREIASMPPQDRPSPAAAILTTAVEPPLATPRLDRNPVRGRH